MGDRNVRGGLRKFSELVGGIAAIFVSTYGFERVWVAAYRAGLPLWGVRTVVLAFIVAVIVFMMLVLAPAVQFLFERLAAEGTLRADERGPRS